MNTDLISQLVDLLMRLPLAATFDGRTALLSNIPSGALNRSESSAFVDLTNLVTQLEPMTSLQGQRTILVLIDNAIRTARGLDIATELEALRRQYEIQAASGGGTTKRDSVLRLSTLTLRQRERLEKELQRLQASLDTYSRRLEAVETDLSRELDLDRGFILKDRRKDLFNKKKEIEKQMDDIDMQLNG